MKLTRPRLLLLAVLLALGGLLAVAWEPLWLAVAYRRVGNPHAPVPYALIKRWEWLPGDSFFHPPQECLPCYFAQRPSEHQRLVALLDEEPRSARNLHLNPVTRREMAATAVASHSDCCQNFDSDIDVYLQKAHRRMAWAYLTAGRKGYPTAYYSAGIPSGWVWYVPVCTCPVCNHREAK